MTLRERERPGRWVMVALGAYVAAVVAMLLLPVGYSEMVRWIGDRTRAALGESPFGDGWIEACANVAVFVPLGGLLTLVLGNRWHGVALALVLSAGAELAQLVIPSRQPSLRDIVANVLGAAVGAALAWLLTVRRERAASAAAAALPQALDSAGEGVPPASEPEAPGRDASH